VPNPPASKIIPKSHMTETWTARLKIVNLGVVRPPLDIGSLMIHRISPVVSQSQHRAISTVMLLSYKIPQLDVEEHDQTNGVVSNCVSETPGLVIGRPPQRGPLRLNVPQRPS
jgi:hypothetical protein